MKMPVEVTTTVTIDANGNSVVHVDNKEMLAKVSTMSGFRRNIQQLSPA